MQTIGITGGTGFIGHHLTKLLMDNGFRIIIFTRDMHKVSRLQNVKYSYWCSPEKKFDLSYLGELDGVINLAGASIERRWTEKAKKEIITSRVEGTKFLIEKLKEHAPQCKVLIAASAIGYYGEDKNGKVSFHEDDAAAEGFLADTCRLWEQANHEADVLMRTAILRFGIVLGKDDGAFPQFAWPQNFGIVPILGNGKQTISWVHVDDLCHIILWALKNEQVKGTFNAVSPQPVSQKELVNTIAKEKTGIKLPIYVPDVLLKMALGEMGAEALKSITVSSDKIQKAGFQFKYPDIQQAVKNILHEKPRADQIDG